MDCCSNPQSLMQKLHCIAISSWTLYHTLQWNCKNWGIQKLEFDQQQDSKCQWHWLKVIATCLNCSVCVVINCAWNSWMLQCKLQWLSVTAMKKHCCHILHFMSWHWGLSTLSQSSLCLVSLSLSRPVCLNLTSIVAIESWSLN